MKKKPRFILIDANSIIHRAYHAYPLELATSKGEQVNAVYGFSAILLKVIEDLKPDFIACAFDVNNKPTFRHTDYPLYKANRKPLEKDLDIQFPRVKEILKAFNIPYIEKEGYEGDDIIGTLNNDKRIKNFDKIIVTGDQDMFQLIDTYTSVYLSGKNFKDSKLYNKKEVIQKTGLFPSQIIDFKAIHGDSSDNIPGISGIGKKGAFDLLKKFKNLNNIYKNINKTGNRYKNKLTEGKEKAYLSYNLAKIYKDVPIDFEILKLGKCKIDILKVEKVFYELEFSSLVKRLFNLGIIPEQENPKSLKNDKELKLFKDDKENSFPELINTCKKAGLITICIQSTHKNICDIIPQKVSLLCKNQLFVFDLKSCENIARKNILKEILENEKIKKVGYDLKALIHAFRNWGIELKGIYFDIKIAAYLIQAGEGGLDLDDLAFKYLGKMFDRQITLNVLNTKKDKYNFERLVEVIWKLYECFSAKLKKEEKSRWNLRKLFYEIEMPLVKVLAQIEFNGIFIDVKYLKEFTSKLDKLIYGEEQGIYKLVGHEFLLTSPKQVSEILFSELSLPKSKRTKGGKYSTGSSVLSELKTMHPVIACLLRHRELAKLRSTYTTTLLESVNTKTNKVHTNFNQTIAATGRLTSTNPNLQNIPISTDLGREMREAFISPAKSVFISFDTSQQELRILAHLSNEKNLIQAFRKGVDIHALTASKIFNKDIKEVNGTERRIGKTINFGVMYGMSAHGLSDALKISVRDAAQFIEKYFNEYPNIKRYFENYLYEAREKGYAETIFGRRKFAFRLKTYNERLKNAIKRELINFPIQGSAADMIKIAMINSQELIERKYDKKAKMILQIHDELVFEYKGIKKRKDFIENITRTIESVYSLKAPIKVDVHIGKNLAQTH